MSVKVILLSLSFVIFHSSYSQILLCNYRYDNKYGYTCDIFIYNPTGAYNFSRISGTHLANRTNEDVKSIVRTTDSNTTNVPYIICDTFQNATRIDLQSIKISKIVENAFWGCKMLSYLNLGYNLLTMIPNFSHSMQKANKYINELQSETHLQHLETLYSHGNQIQEIPPKTFNSLVNLKLLYLNDNKIKKLFSESFEFLGNLTSLYLYGNKIEEIPIFEPLEKLTNLYLHSNQIVEFPSNVFSSLKQLAEISLNSNKLKIIHTFGILPKLTSVYLQNNQIEAFDQNLIDDTGVETLDMRNNLCANFTITDSTTWRQQMRIQLLKCFENYANIEVGTTSIPTTVSSTTESTTTAITLPPGCIEGRLDERVCRLEDKNEEFEENFYNQDILNNEMQENFKNHSTAIEELQKKIEELTNRPCACN